MIEKPDVLMPLSSAIADVTSWFDWNALGAIGTVGALWFAVVQSSRSIRAARANQIGILTLLVGYIEPLTEALCLEDDVSCALDPLGPAHVVQMVERALAGLRSLSVADTASVHATEWTTALPIALAAILNAVRNWDATSPHDAELNSNIRYLWEANEFFRDSRDRIRYNFVERRVRHLLCDLHMRWKWRVARRRLG
jgi:hypothetical protein